ncbi:YhgE/Pip family protein [Amycolatopsis sp. w19]|uniref:YhgE/Pip family protein n=1 Tax=Amycolatopsis sp. w19 TaxID=3448134 RepID=UPI003F1C5C32
MSRFFTGSARATAIGPLTWKTWLGIVLVPVIVALGLAWAFWSPEDNHGAAKAAVVNDDEPVTVNGQLIPLGRELAGNLVHGEDSAYTWVLTDAEDAKEGISDGTYSAVVTIPRDFSAQATSTSGKPLDAKQAIMRVETSQRTGLVDPVASREVANATLTALNRQIVETYVDNLYVGFSSIHQQLVQAADGSDQLVVGLRQLSDGTGKLAAGAGELAGGAGKLSGAAGQLADGARELANGTGQLATGSGQLSSGLTQAEKDTAQLPRLTRELADGAQQVANGNKQLSDKISPLADKVVRIIDALPSAGDSARKFGELAGKCDQDTKFCADLKAASEKLTADAAILDGKRAEIRDAVVQTKKAVQDLSAGSRKVADGNKQLADKSKELAGGIGTAADGARKLDAGVKAADSGARRLADGSGQLAGGATTLSTGAGELATGARSAADGAERAESGASELAKGLNEGRGKVPDYTQAERDHLKQVAATPAIADAAGSGSFGEGAVALILVLALWGCALATYQVIRAVPPSVLTTREPSWRIILAAAVPGATLAVLTALILTGVFWAFLGLSFGKAATLLVVLVLAAGTFTVVNQALVAIFKRPGRFAALAILVLTVGASLVSTVPGFFGTVLGILPTNGALVALRSLLTGTDGLTSGIVQLVVWLGIGTLAMILVTDRRRSLPGRELRLPLGGM